MTAEKLTQEQKFATWAIDDAFKAASLAENPDNPDHRQTMIDFADRRAVDLFRTLMAQKLETARDAGRYGWHDPEVCSIADLRRMFDEQCLRAHPDFIDVANFAMMLFFRTRGMPGFDPAASISADV